MLATLKKLIGKRPASPLEMSSAEAYNIWAQSYDAQPDNLMLALDEDVFSGLLANVELTGKSIADMGCGTGRHWPKMFDKHPARLTGFDVSPGMLERLQAKVPQAETSLITSETFSDIPDASFDVIVSTLTVAHIQNIDETLRTWGRLLRPKSDIIITDFHPDALAKGGKRTFADAGRLISVRNYVHPVAHIAKVLIQNNFILVSKDERLVDASVKHYYTAQNALPVYERFKGQKIIYGIHLKRR